MMGDGSLLKLCPARYQRLVMISGDYHVEYYEVGDWRCWNDEAMMRMAAFTACVFFV